MNRWVSKVTRVVRNATYREERCGETPELVEVKYMAVEPFWAVIEPEEPPNEGVFLFTYSGDQDDEGPGATWYRSEAAAREAAALEFGLGEDDLWAPLPEDVTDRQNFARFVAMGPAKDRRSFRDSAAAEPSLRGGENGESGGSPLS